MECCSSTLQRTNKGFWELESLHKSIYNYEKDEPVRELNAMIAEKIGYQPLKLEETEHHEEDDGTKLWFAVHLEKSMML